MTQQPQTSLDYLNQIAPVAPKSNSLKSKFKLLIIGSVAAIAFVLILAAIAGNVANGNKRPWQQLSLRLEATTTIATAATKNIKNSDLKSLNSNLKLYLANTSRDFTTHLATAGVEMKKVPDSVTKSEDITDLTTRLEDARLNAKFDSTYAREMSYQLATILSLYQQLYASTRDQATKAFLTEAYDNLLPTQESLAGYSASSE